MAAQFIIMPIVFIFVYLIVFGIGLWGIRRQKLQRKALLEQGYQITVVNVNGREGFIATPPQQHVVTVQQQPAPSVVDAPPSYYVSSNPNNASVHYPNNAPPVYYSATPNQPKY